MVALFRNAVSLSVAFTSSCGPFRSRSSSRLVRWLSGASFVLNDADKRIQFPNHKYGYRTEPLSWEEVQKIVEHDDLASFSRSVEEQKRYELYKREVLERWHTLLDHVLVEKFPFVFERRVHPDINHKYVAHPGLETVISEDHAETTLVKNDFPYYVADDIQHWVYWKLGGGWCTMSEIETAQTLLLEKESAIDSVHWINPVPLKSIPEIDHVHFLIRHRID